MSILEALGLKEPRYEIFSFEKGFSLPKDKWGNSVIPKEEVNKVGVYLAKGKKINLHSLALRIAKHEKGKKQVNIAQIKEILKVTLLELSKEDKAALLNAIANAYIDSFKVKKGKK